MPLIFETQELKINPLTWNIDLLNKIDEINKEYKNLSIGLGGYRKFLDRNDKPYYVWPLYIEKSLTIEIETLIRSIFDFWCSFSRNFYI